MTTPDGTIIPFDVSLAADPTYVPTIEVEIMWAGSIYVGHYYLDGERFEAQQYAVSYAKRGHQVGKPFTVSKKKHRRLYFRMRNLASTATLDHDTKPYARFALPLIKRAYPTLIA